MVEVAGIEPASESVPHQVSTCLFPVLHLTSENSRGQDFSEAIPLSSYPGIAEKTPEPARFNDISGSPQARDQEMWSLFKRPVRKKRRCRRLLFTGLITGPTGLPDMQPVLPTPVETLSPP